MPTLDLNTENFESAVLCEGIVLIDCWASWCKGCKDFEPVFDAVAAAHPVHTFAKLDTQEQRELSERLGIRHIPTLILFRDGLLLLRQPGYVAESDLAQLIQQAESVDMEQIRADLAERESTQE